MRIYRNVSLALTRGGLAAIEMSLRVIFILLVAGPAFAGYSASSAQELLEAYSQTLPHFDTTQRTDVSAVAGQPVLMPCVVFNLTDKLVSWIRTRDLNILTHGTATFTADPRFDIQHQHDAGSWSLKINPTRISDAGRYECQVNTDPKMSLFFNLKVYEHATPTLKARLSGPKDQYVGEGSTVTFVCEVTLEGHDVDTFRPRRAASVHWLHNGLAVSFQASRGGISIDTTRTEQAVNSRLTLAGVSAADEGRYTCGVDDVADSLQLHVTNEVVDYGEHMEAMQRDQAASGAAGCIHRETALVSAALVVMIGRRVTTVR